MVRRLMEAEGNTEKVSKHLNREGRLMSYFIRVFCVSDYPITRYEIARFIEDGVFYDNAPVFEPSPDNDSPHQTNWHHLSIIYDPDKRPMLIEKNVPTDRLFQDEIKEITEVLMQQGTNKSVLLIEQVQKAQQIIAIEVDRDRITDETWAMLAALEAYLAKRLSGIIYAPDDGFYDQNLHVIWKLSEQDDDAASG
jgi:hypothetical protein